MDDTTFAMEGYTIDLDALYRRMHAQSVWSRFDGSV